MMTNVDNEEGFADFSRLYTVFLIILTVLTFFNSRFFLVKQVEVRNHRKISPEEIMVLAGISRRQTIFQIRPTEIERRILKNPMIAGAKISVIFPDKVRIIVKERIPLCVLPYHKQYVCIAEDGVVLGFPVNKEESHIPLVLGCSFATPILGEKLKSGQLGEAMKLLSYADNTLKKSLRTVDLNHLRLYLKNADNASIPVELGSLGQLEQKVSNLRAIIHQNNFNCITGIDLRIRDIPTVVFKK